MGGLRGSYQGSTVLLGIGMGTEQGPGLPEAADAVAVEESLIRDEDEVARKHLGDEHSAEGVTERARQRAGARGVLCGDGQFLKVLSGYCPGNVKHQRFRVREFAEPMLGIEQ